MHLKHMLNIYDVSTSYKLLLRFKNFSCNRDKQERRNKLSHKTELHIYQCITK